MNTTSLYGCIMAEKLQPQIWLPERLTRLGEFLSLKLEQKGQPVITDYELFKLVSSSYKSKKKLYLRKSTPSNQDYNRARRNLIEANVIKRDRDYHSAYRIIANQDLPAEDVCCIIDPFCYISHLSAMQRYGFSDRRPKSLHLTVPGPTILIKLKKEFLLKEGDENLGEHKSIIPFRYITHPKNVRKRSIELFHTKYLGEKIKIRGNTYARISTVGQTFLDMLVEPTLCGGMSHVLEVWKEHAKLYVEEIISSVDKTPKTITKIRAGYILDEVLGINNPRIESWLKYAQRGGSRLLDPLRSYEPIYSEKWMISINA